jgi:nucleoredoxin
MVDSVLDLLPQELIKKTDVYALTQVIEYEKFGLYFSAHWCPPCRLFTPVLVDFYNKINEKEKKLEIIFVSNDQSPQQFNEYYKTMPWCAVNFDDDIRDTLGEAFQINGIPTLLVFDNKGKKLCDDARTIIEENYDKKTKESALKAFEKLNNSDNE